MIKKVYNEDLENLSLETVDYFFSSVRELSKIKNKIFVGLSGGSSLNDFYENLVFLSKGLEKECWEKIIFCFADERIVDLEDDDSNYKQLKKLFLDKLIDKNIINSNQIIKINPNSKTVNSDYSKLIREVNILLLGVGPDGHIASLFPNHKLLENDFNNYLLIEDSPKLPLKRITISKKMIENSNFTFIFFIGDSKLDAYKNFNDSNLEYLKCPAKLVINSKKTFIITNLDNI